MADTLSNLSAIEMSNFKIFPTILSINLRTYCVIFLIIFLFKIYFV